jgi:hypothetical protein
MQPLVKAIRFDRREAADHGRRPRLGERPRRRLRTARDPAKGASSPRCTRITSPTATSSVLGQDNRAGRSEGCRSSPASLGENDCAHGLHRRLHSLGRRATACPTSAGPVTRGTANRARAETELGGSRRPRVRMASAAPREPVIAHRTRSRRGCRDWPMRLTPHCPATRSAPTGTASALLRIQPGGPLLAPCTLELGEERVFMCCAGSGLLSRTTAARDRLRGRSRRHIVHVARERGAQRSWGGSDASTCSAFGTRVWARDMAPERPASCGWPPGRRFTSGTPPVGARARAQLPRPGPRPQNCRRPSQTRPRSWDGNRRVLGATGGSARTGLKHVLPLAGVAERGRTAPRPRRDLRDPPRLGHVTTRR